MKAEDFLRPLVYSRVLDHFYHHCHNLTYGESFVSDHALFAAFYAELGLQYDQLAEYLIATTGSASFQTQMINDAVAQKLSEYPVETMSPEIMFSVALQLEAEYYEYLVRLDAVGSVGVKNMVGAMAELADVRKYKIQQRLK